MDKRWQSIETMPKDGTEFLAYFPDSKWVDDGSDWGVLCSVIAIVKSDERGCLEGNTYFLTPNGGPTHWMGLPEPPVDGTKSD